MTKCVTGNPALLFFFWEVVFFFFFPETFLLSPSPLFFFLLPSQGALVSVRVSTRRPQADLAGPDDMFPHFPLVGFTFGMFNADPFFWGSLKQRWHSRCNAGFPFHLLSSFPSTFPLLKLLFLFGQWTG